ncbi:MAG: hypothetical protein IKO21_00520 [Fibrobacter sp.]|nr:hypothetical protein [Fibrobacter sp.]
MKNKLLAFLISSAFLFAACGDSTSASTDSSTEESSSSEKDAKSSSSEDGDKVSSSSEKASDNSSSSTKDGSTSSSSVSTKSSSSEAPETSSSSVETPIGTRVAELEELEKNMELKLSDITVYLSTGSKKGLMTLRIPDELWAVTYTDFANGSVTFKMDDVGLLYSETDAAKTIVEMMNEGIKISFAIEESDGRILYSLNDWDGYTDAVKASVAVQKGKVSKAEVIQNKIYACADGDSTKTFKFLESSYTYEVSVDNNVVDWHAGHYDIQRSSLLMRPLRDAETSRSLYIYSVGEDNTITADNGEVMNCTVDDAENDDDL